MEAERLQVMKVLHVIPGLEDNAVSMGFVRRQIPAIAACGVVCETHFLDTRLNLSSLVRAWMGLRSAVRTKRPDVVHAHFGSLTGIVCVLASRVPVVVNFRGSDLNPDPTVSVLRSLLQTAFSQVAALGARRMICVSRQLALRLWWRRDRVRLIPTGVDLELFKPIERGIARQQLGWPEQAAVVLFNGSARGNLNKRPDLAQAAVAVAKTELGRDVLLYKIEGRVPPAQMPILMSAADALIMTSDYEGSPNVVKEAMACDLPVVSVEVGDVIERLEGVSPSSICSRDPTELGTALAEILLLGIRSNGRSRAVGISRESVAARIVEVYMECLRPLRVAGRRATEV